MENEFELKPFDKVLVRDKNTKVWVIDIFEKYEDSTSGFCYNCMTSLWKQCIPYKGNEHLLGTTDSPQKDGPQEETEKKDEVSNNYGYPVEYFKRNDLVLCRDNKDSYWRIDIFLYKKDDTPYPFRCTNSVWLECIPYEGNEHLSGTTDSPERNDIDKNTLFGVKLKSGYVLELEDDEVGILFPTANGFAISYTKGCWQSLNDIEKDTIVKIFGIAKNGFIRSGELLWEKPNPKVIFTKAQIAEKLNLNVNDFEITD